MPDSNPLIVRKLGSKKPLLRIVLVEGGDVWVADGKKKIHPLPHAFHTCGDRADEPEFLDQLSLAGLVDIDINFRGPASFIPAPVVKKAGFYYAPSQREAGKRGNGEWEATDSGGGLHKKKRARPKRNDAKRNHDK